MVEVGLPSTRILSRLSSLLRDLLASLDIEVEEALKKRKMFMVECNNLPFHEIYVSVLSCLLFLYTVSASSKALSPSVPLTFLSLL
jgi:hypothetical protein